MEASPNAFRDKILVITGGTGTFGNAVLQRMLRMGLKEIRILSRDEKKQDDMRRQYNNPLLRFYLGDIREASSLVDAMAGADYVFHAAALKQVPSCEFYPMEAIRTNSLGADNVMNAAVNAGVSRLVVLSTDKAAYPINAMGMSKALMEKLMVARSRVAAERGCILTGTRYGNVMGSRGSVIPLFISQIQEGKPLTITDSRMTRFMMSIEHAVELVLYAFEHASPGDLFVQKAPACTIGTLAEAMLKLFDSDLGMREIGIRHGEKLYETLLTREEMARADDCGDYYRVRPDGRDLNYEAFFSQGEPTAAQASEYHSHNATRLDVDQMIEVLRGLPVVQSALATTRAGRSTEAVGGAIRPTPSFTG